MSYTPPNGNGVGITFSTSYTPPAGNAVVFNLAAADVAAYIYPAGFDALEAGWIPTVIWNQTLPLSGWDSAVGGTLAPVYERFTVDHDFTDAYSAPSGSSVSHNFSTGLYVLPSGLDAAQFGAHQFETTPGITPAGMNTAVFGTAIVFKHQFVNPSGLDGSGFGATFIENKNRDLPLTGFDVAAFGTHVLTRTNYTQYQPVDGFDVARVGAHVVARGGVQPAGFDSAQFGTAFVDYATRTIYPIGFGTAEFGETTEITNFYQYPEFFGFSAAEVGADTRVRRWGIYPYAATNAAEFGTATVTNFRRFIDLTGWSINAGYVPWLPGERHVVANKTQYPALPGFDAARFGTTKVANWRQYITPVGIAPIAVGAGGFIAFRIRYINPVGRDYAVVWNDYGPIDPVTGKPARIYNETSILTPAGFDVAALGAPQITRQHVSTDWSMRVRFGNYWGFDPSGFDSSVFGEAQLLLGPAWLYPASIVGAEFGDHRMAHRVAPAGFDIAAFGAHRLNQNAAASGFDAAVFGTAQLNMRVIASGFDSAQFGTALLSATVSPAGWSALDMGADYAAEDYFAEDYHDRDYAVTVRHA